MAWCPQCGAEYREGVEACAKCGVGLVGERPAAAAPRPAAPAVVRKVWDDAKRAWGYLAGAGRLLKRNPTLLLLPLAVVVFNTVEGTAGSQIMARHTAYGRQLTERIRNARVVKRGPQSRFLRIRVGLGLTGPDTPSISLSGTMSIAGAALQGGHRAGEQSGARSQVLLWLLGLAAGCFVLGPLNGLVRAGYYGVAARAVASGKPNWQEFGLWARRLFVRLWALYALLIILEFALFWLASLPGRGGIVSGAAWSLFVWGCRGIAFFLVLAPFVIVADGCGVVTGIRRSVLSVARDIVVATALTVGVGLVGWAVAYGFGWLRGWAWALDSSSDLAQVHWSRLAVDLGQHRILALLSAVFVLAALIWYREASAKWWPATAAEGAGIADRTR